MTISKRRRLRRALNAAMFAGTLATSPVWILPYLAWCVWRDRGSLRW